MDVDALQQSTGPAFLVECESIEPDLAQLQTVVMRIKAYDEELCFFIHTSSENNSTKSVCV